MSLLPQKYYNECRIREKIRTKEDDVRSIHLRQMFVKGVITERTKAEHFLPSDILGNVYPYRDETSGWGLRARNKIPAGNRIFSYGTSRNNFIDADGIRIYYGRMWTFMEYYTNYGFEKKDEEFEILLRPNVIEKMHGGTWYGYDGKTLSESTKQLVRNNKDRYKFTGELVHGTVLELTNTAPAVYEMLMGPYNEMEINMVGVGQLLFCQDEKGEILVLGVVTSVDNRKVTIETESVMSSCCCERNGSVRTGQKILTKMVMDPTFVGYVNGGHGTHQRRPSVESIYSKTTDSLYDWHKDGTPISMYWEILANSDKTKDERQLARRILKCIGFPGFSNEPAEHTHASMVVPFIGECYGLSTLREESIPDYPSTLRTVMHPDNMYMMQALAAFDIEEGEKLTWLYGDAHSEDYLPGYPPRRTVIYKLVPKDKKRKKGDPKYILGSKVLFQYRLKDNTIHDLVIPVPRENCRVSEFKHRRHIPGVLSRDGRCLVHPRHRKAIGNGMYGPLLVSGGVIYHATPPLTRNRAFYRWQLPFSLDSTNENDVVVLYGGVPHFRIKKDEEQDQPFIEAAKLFFANETFNNILSLFRHDAVTKKKWNVQIVDYSSRTIAVQPKIRYKNRQKYIWDIRGCILYAEQQEPRMVTKEIIVKENNTVKLGLNLPVQWKKTCYFYEYKMARRVEKGEKVATVPQIAYAKYVEQVKVMIARYNQCIR